jgi:hypothetical protein
MYRIVLYRLVNKNGDSKRKAFSTTQMTSNVEDEFADGAAAAAEAEAKQQKEKEQSRPKHIKFDDDDKRDDDAGGDDDNGKQSTNVEDNRMRTEPARCKFENDKSRMAK